MMFSTLHNMVSHAVKRRYILILDYAENCIHLVHFSA